MRFQRKLLTFSMSVYVRVANMCAYTWVNARRCTSPPSHTEGDLIVGVPQTHLEVESLTCRVKVKLCFRAQNWKTCTTSLQVDWTIRSLIDDDCQACTHTRVRSTDSNFKWCWITRYDQISGCSCWGSSSFSAIRELKDNTRLNGIVL